MTIQALLQALRDSVKEVRAAAEQLRGWLLTLSRAEPRESGRRAHTRLQTRTLARTLAHT